MAALSPAEAQAAATQPVTWPGAFFRPFSGGVRVRPSGVLRLSGTGRAPLRAAPGSIALALRPLPVLGARKA